MSWFTKKPKLDEVYTDIYDVLAWQEAHELLDNKLSELCTELPSAAYSKIYHAKVYLDKHLNNRYKEVFS